MSSACNAVWHLLAHNSGLLAQVPAARIKSGVLPQGTALPAISITHVSGLQRKEIAAAATKFIVSRVQVTVLAADYVTQNAVLALVRAALPRTHSTVNGVALQGLVEDLIGPDFRDDEAGICMQSIDYIVSYNE